MSVIPWRLSSMIHAPRGHRRRSGRRGGFRGSPASGSAAGACGGLWFWCSAGSQGSARMARSAMVTPPRGRTAALVGGSPRRVPWALRDVTCGNDAHAVALPDGCGSWHDRRRSAPKAWCLLTSVTVSGDSGKGVLLTSCTNELRCVTPGTPSLSCVTCGNVNYPALGKLHVGHPPRRQSLR